MSPSLPEHLRSTLARHHASWRAIKAGVIFATLIALFVVAATASRNPDLSHVKVAFLSGSQTANYHAIVDRAGAEARRRQGRIENIVSAGSVENMVRLAEAKSSCNVQFALVQDGLPWPASHPFQLIARLPDPESLVILGRDADLVRSLNDVRGKRVGVGPMGSGTEHVSRQIIAELRELDLRPATHPLEEQLAMLEAGRLDFAAMVIDADARLVADAVRERGLQIMDIAVADAIAHRLPSAREGIIKAGAYDPVRGLPPIDKRVIQIDTLVIGNGCARESATQGVLDVLARVFPELVRVNRERPNLTGLQYASAAQSYFDNQGPDRVAEYVPWLIDIMPMARWLQLVFVFSMLFAGQALWHRFRLWRIDARRVALESELAQIIAARVTVYELAEMQPDARYRTNESRERTDDLIAELERLGKRCRRQSLSMLVPMGHEMNYRYQERLIDDWLHALRRFRRKLDDPR